MWETSGKHEGRYTVCWKTLGSKESSSSAKVRAMNELYAELETPEDERNISRIAKPTD